ncbi:exported hypothetical protein [Candidatus Sulfopaludibacter sp. SbA3]|nr:exported hypothetical protein [Candidatus Sulfopaludibacter sp. SbA3]
MRNWTRLSGVYCNMLRVTLILVCSWSALAQLSQWQNPMNTALQAVWQARNEGRFAEAAAAREQARALLQRVAADSPGFAGWAQQVAQLYASSSLNGQARVILQDALARTAPLGETPPSHIAMLSALGESWRQDGNLLKAVGYLEQAAAAQAAAPLPAPGQKDQRSMVIMGVISGSFRSYGGYGGGAIYTYSRLADLYRQLGRPDAVAAVAIKIRALSASDPMALAQFYMQQGRLPRSTRSWPNNRRTRKPSRMPGSLWRISMPARSASPTPSTPCSRPSRQRNRRTSLVFASKRCGCARIWRATCARPGGSSRPTRSINSSCRRTGTRCSSRNC